MIRNYIKMALRNIFRNKVHSTINIVGLSIGITCFIIIYLWIKDETSFDKFHSNSDCIYRLLYTPSNSNEKNAAHPNLLLPAITEKIPEIKNSSRFKTYKSPTIEIDNETFITNEIIFTEPQFFELFDFDVLVGNPIKALKEPFTIFITKSAAKKYFKSENIVGKTIEYENKYIFTIKGIIDDFPTNSHIQGDFVASYESYKTINSFSFQNWYVRMANNYLLLPKDINLSEIELKIKQHVNEIKPEYYKDYDYILEPLEKIHLYSSETKDNRSIKGNIEYVIIFSVIIILIILIVSFNYTNLTISHFAKEFKNIGIKKTIGAKSGQVANEVFFFTFIICFISLWISSIAIEAVLPAFNNFTGKNLIFDPFSNVELILVLITLLISLILLSGSYPAFFVSRLKPLDALQGFSNSNPKAGKKSIHARLSKLILSFQFCVSIILISFSIIISKQLTFLTEDKLGFNKEHIVIIDNPWDSRYLKRFNFLKDKSNDFSAIQGVSCTRNSPGESINNWTEIYKDSKMNNGINCGRVHVDVEYLDLIQANFIAGRNFSHNLSTDSTCAIINKSLQNALETNEPIGSTLYAYFNEGIPLKIIGVIDDIQTISLKYKEVPTIYFLYDMNKPDILVKFTEGNMNNSIQFLEKTWKEIEPDWPFQFQLLDDKINSSYKTEIKAKQTIKFLTIIAIVLSCLGILGLVGFYVDKRTKEIAIRKINGSPVNGIITLLSKEYLFNIILSSIISIPIIIYLAKKWLQNYVFQIELAWWYFVISSLLMIVITFLTISYYVLKAARKNPVESLRYE